MATSVIGICNSALAKIGAASILSLTDGSAQASRCNEAFSRCLDDVLRQYPWPCALARATLARLADAPAWGFSYAYQLPADCLRVVEVDGDASASCRLEGSTIVSDLEALSILYVRHLTDMNRLSASLAEVVALRLASELVYAISGNATQQELFYKEYLTALANEKLLAAQEQRIDQSVNTYWTDAR